MDSGHFFHMSKVSVAIQTWIQVDGFLGPIGHVKFLYGEHTQKSEIYGLAI